MNLNCSNVVIYEKKQVDNFGNLIKSTIRGLKGKKGYIYKYIDFNEFEKKESKIPDDYVKLKKSSYSNSWVKKFICDPSRKLLEKNNNYYKKIKNKHKNEKTYFIHDNNGRPFLVYVNIKNKRVSIYKQSQKHWYPANKWSKNINNNKWVYIKFIKTYKYQKIFIGKSNLTELSRLGGGYGKKFYGNSILLKINSKKHVFIGQNIYEFNTTEIINEYYSTVGNNDVPYPVAIGEKNTYFMLDKRYLSNRYFIEKQSFSKNIKQNAYLYYYGHKGEQLSKYSKKMQSIKIVNKRDDYF